jgi:hypothetical protein
MPPPEPLSSRRELCKPVVTVPPRKVAPIKAQANKGNAKQKDTEIPSHPSQIGHHQENKLQQRPARMQAYPVGGNVNYCNRYEKQ